MDPIDVETLNLCHADAFWPKCKDEIVIARWAGLVSVVTVPEKKRFLRPDRPEQTYVVHDFSTKAKLTDAIKTSIEQRPDILPTLLLAKRQQQT